MSAFGYRDGEAVVSYEYGAPPNCVDSGEGEFAQWVSHSNVLAVGQIPAGKWNVDVQLEARGGRDIDIQLFDGDYAIVKWDANESNVGDLSGPTQGTTDYEGMKITYSGYNGRDQNWGKEDIRVSGKLTRTLTIKVFGYAEGYADVTYSWGHGAEGDSCGGRTAVPPHPCQENLVCKGSGLATDQTGVCRPLNWCDSRSTAAMDCRGLVHPAFPGAWTCIGHECTWTDSGNGPLTISAATLAANPGAYDGKTVTITDSIVEGLAACTKMLCSPWNPCCNTCNGTQAFKVGGQQIQLKGLTCIGNECNWEQNCSFDSGALVQVTGVVEVQTFGANVIISINVSDSQEL